MAIEKVLFFSLLLIWFFQLSAITANLPLLDYAYGDITEIRIQPKVNQHNLLLQSEKMYRKAALTAKQITFGGENIIFVGDVLLARNVEKLIKEKGGDYPFTGLNFNDFAPKPIVVANFEGVVPAEHISTEAGEMRFSVPAATVKYLKKHGYTYLSLANNHSLDFGKVGFINTVKTLRENGLEVFGSSDISDMTYKVIPWGNKRVALIGLQLLDGKVTKTEVAKIMQKANQESDLQFFYLHWGTEYRDLSTSKQRKMARFMVAQGADLIVGVHPHVVEEVSLIDGVPVFYSLGNYIFDQYFSDKVQTGLVLNLDGATSSPRIDLIPVTSRLTRSQPRRMSPEEHQRFLMTLADKSDPALSTYIRRGFVPLYSEVATSTKMTMIKTYVQ